MDESLVSALMAGIGVILAAWLGFAGSKKGTLATAEKDFRTTILEDNKQLRERVEQLETQLVAVKKENHQMQLKMIEITSPAPVVVEVTSSVGITQSGGGPSGTNEESN